VVKLGCERMECVFQGESSHAGRIKIVRNGLLVMVEYAMARRTDFRRSSCLKLGTTRHEVVHW
jgi:hypothetical protein